MRKLFLTFGVPAIGKSTFIKENKLEQYTVEIDKIRTLFGSTKRFIDDDNNIVNTTVNDQDNQVWDFAYHIAENNMSQGKTVIIDATFLYPNAFDKARELAHKYNYKIELIDFMQDIVKDLSITTKNQDKLIDFLITRDRNRNQNIPRYVFERYVNRYFDTSSENNGKTITPSEFKEKYLTPIKPIDLNEFNRIKIIGDVHGDFGSLLKPFDDHKRGDAYIFVGDYLDRGSKNAETFKFMHKLKGKNIFLLKGNHEKHLYNFALGNKIHSRDFKSITLPELMSANITKDDISEFTKRLQNYLYFTFDNQTFMVSHAGIEPTRLNAFETSSETKDSITFADEEEFVNGLSKLRETPYETDVDERQSLSNLKTIQVHGHRNNYNYDTQVSKNMYNLTGSFAHDTFRYIVLNKD